MKHPSTSIKILTRNQKQFRKKLVAKIDSYNKSKSGPPRLKELRLEARTDKGKFAGGLTGLRYLGWLYVDILFVEEKYRGQDLGTKLLRKAESWAKQNGCKYIHLSSFSFQAPGFYKKFGYRVHGFLKPYPKGHARYYLKKKL